MKIDAISVIDGMSGKLNKREKLVFSNRFGNIHAWEVNPHTGPFTENQKRVHERFKATTALVNEELADPVKLAEWTAVAKNSGGKWKTARGAAFAALFKAADVE